MTEVGCSLKHSSVFQVKSMKLDGVVVETDCDVETANEAVDEALNSVGSLISKHKHDTIIRVSWKGKRCDFQGFSRVQKMVLLLMQEPKF